ELIDRTRAACAIVRLVTIDASRAASLKRSSYCQGISGQRHGNTKLVAPSCIGGFHIGLLHPCGSTLPEHIHCAGVDRVIVCLVAIGSRRPAAFTRSSDCQNVAGEGHRATKAVIGSGV